MSWQAYETKYVLSQENVSFCSKKVKLGFKNVNNENNKREALLLLDDDINILKCER